MKEIGRTPHRINFREKSSTWWERSQNRTSGGRRSLNCNRTATALPVQPLHNTMDRKE